jgi:hypothetical protein
LRNGRRHVVVGGLLFLMKGRGLDEAGRLLRGERVAGRRRGGGLDVGELAVSTGLE